MFAVDTAGSGKQPAGGAHVPGLDAAAAVQSEWWHPSLLAVCVCVCVCVCVRVDVWVFVNVRYREIHVILKRLTPGAWTNLLQIWFQVNLENKKISVENLISDVLKKRKLLLKIGFQMSLIKENLLKILFQIFWEKGDIHWKPYFKYTWKRRDIHWKSDFKYP